MATEIRSDKKALFDYIAVVHGPILADQMWRNTEAHAVNTIRSVAYGVRPGRVGAFLHRAKLETWAAFSKHLVLDDRARFDEMWARVEAVCGYHRDDRNCLQKALGAMGLMR